MGHVVGKGTYGNVKVATMKRLSGTNKKFSIKSVPREDCSLEWMQNELLIL